MYLQMLTFPSQRDHVDYSENGGECKSKCKRFRNSNTSSFNMTCRDDADFWRLCTPFSSKIWNNINPLTYKTYIFSHHCISDLGYTDYGEECSTPCHVDQQYSMTQMNGIIGARQLMPQQVGTGALQLFQVNIFKFLQDSCMILEFCY